METLLLRVALAEEGNHDTANVGTKPATALAGDDQVVPKGDTGGGGGNHNTIVADGRPRGRHCP